MSQEIYTGVWTDWSLGSVQGVTITLSARDGGLLLAFIAIFVTFVTTRAWRIIAFAAHQSMASGGKHDGLYYQRQFILRNITSPIAAAWLFMQQSWYWRPFANKGLARTVPWALCALAYAGLFAAAAVFSAEISTGASKFRLLKATNCGIFTPADRDAFQGKELFDNQVSSMYSRQCYSDNSSAACSSLPVSSIRWTNESVDCPFADRICLGHRGFRMESERINSHNHLGINAPEQNRIFYSRETVCSPLVTQPGFIQYVNGSEAKELGWPDNILIKYLYGSRGDRNYTYIYNTYGQNMQTGYSTWTYYTLAGRNDSTWKPAEALEVEHRDLTLMLIAPNSIIHMEPNDDPVFAANNPMNIGGVIAYLPDRFVSPIACADGHQICNPMNDQCTPFLGSSELLEAARGGRLGLNPTQVATVTRLGPAVSLSTFYNLIWTRTQSFLRAQELVGGLTQLPLPSNQWEIEMESLMADALAGLQHQTLEYVTGPAAPSRGTTLQLWDTLPESASVAAEDIRVPLRELCGSQRIRETQGTLNFSVVGLGVLFGVGSAMIIASLLLEPLTRFVQMRTGWGTLKAKRWERDDSLQVMRLLFELRDAGLWKGNTESFPTTETKDNFEFDEDYLG
ncbi:uncharacterized protein CTRU02_202825 [Colletotrichum truncatum]|uniref:Uncharacterized protein n=1 Tax=Colletotrichum truncatum TaxID=5467 RepID=A0ACC3ZLT2_COLTU|nr:uncharacterized protein CTRU02_12919 [Colletotrichum truncatum]KAF6783903.1 hypothetical protein CTRU02_12919 [Colletotrichum truncatum]